MKTKGTEKWGVPEGQESQKRVQEGAVKRKKARESVIEVSERKRFRKDLINCVTCFCECLRVFEGCI